MKNVWLHVCLTALLLLSLPVNAGNCSCQDQIDNASAEVSGSCSKIWSNNHCTLKEDGATSSAMAFSDVSAAFVDLSERIAENGFFSNDEAEGVTGLIQSPETVTAVRQHCYNSEPIPQGLFEA